MTERTPLPPTTHSLSLRLVKSLQVLFQRSCAARTPSEAPFATLSSSSIDLTMARRDGASLQGISSFRLFFCFYAPFFLFYPSAAPSRAAFTDPPQCRPLLP